jgi:hypothetical protein
VPSEAARLDLYNGLNELLGPERAETLMASLPNFGPNGVATSADFGVLQARMDSLETGLGARMDRLETRMTSIESAVVALGLRFDKMFLAMLAGLFAIVAALVGVIIAV